MAFAVPTGTACPRKPALAREHAALALFASVLCAALAVVLLLHRDLPMLDLPQHAVEVATWLRWPTLPSAVRDELELNLRTPYLMAYALARTAAPLGVVPALKSVVLLAAVFNLLAVLALARRLGHSPWLSLLGLPITFGFSFYFGFVSFLLATPLVIYALALGLDHATRPRWSSALTLGALLCAILVAHGFALGIALISVAGLLVFSPVRRDLRSWLLRLAPLAAPLLLGLVWLAPAFGPSLNDSTIRLDRVTRWLPMLFGVGSFADRVAIVSGVLFLGLVASSLGRLSRAPSRWSLLAVTLLGYALVPEMLWNTAFLHERLAGFLLPALLLACEPQQLKERHARRIALATAGACALWLLVFSVRLTAFNREMADYHALIDGLPAGLRVRPLIFDRDSRAFPSAPVYTHVSAYYHAEKGGIPAYWFAVQPGAVVRYKPGRVSALAPGAEWAPERFDAAQEGGNYDYFLLRGESPRADLFADSQLPIELDTCRGQFCGYRRRQSQSVSE